MNNEVLISKKVLADFILNELDSDRELFLKQLSYFLDHLTEFKKAGHDPVKLGQLAHKIKVGCRCFGAENFETAMEQIENLVKNNSLKPDSEIFRLTTSRIDPLVKAIEETSEEIFRKGSLSE